MMILTIGDTSRRLSSSAPIDESWVTLLMRSAGADTPPGVHVRIAAPAVALNLSAGEQSGTVCTGALTSLESIIVDLWHQRGLDRPEFRSGQLVAFLHQLQDVLEQDRADRVAIFTGPCAVTADVM